jgi:hypothetical protein
MFMRTLIDVSVHLFVMRENVWYNERRSERLRD